MTPTIRLSRKVAQAILGDLERYWESEPLPAPRYVAELRTQLGKVKPAKNYAPKRKLPRKAPGTSTKAVYKAVAKRAPLVCECGCGRWFRGVGGAATVDHFEGRARSENVETCWRIRSDCHVSKTASAPSREAWFRKFIDHCERVGFDGQAEKTRADLEYHLAKMGKAVAP